jgi:hypothetical protein
MRIAVLGLFNSGSTALAKCLYRLGVNMGEPFWCDDDAESKNNFYEPKDLREDLVRIWDEPRFVERQGQKERVRILRQWIEKQERKGGTHFGAKHPLLAMAPDDLPWAWGAGTKYIWAARHLDNSIEGLVQRKWFPWAESIAVQYTLIRRLETFFAHGTHDVLRMDHDTVVRQKAMAVDRLIAFLGLPEDAKRRDYAIAGIRKPPARLPERPCPRTFPEPLK